MIWGNINCWSWHVCLKKKGPHGLHKCSQYWSIAHFQLLTLQRCSLHPTKRREDWRKYGFIYAYQSLIQCLHNLYKHKLLSLNISNVQIHYSNLHKLPSKLTIWLSKIATNESPFLYNTKLVYHLPWSKYHLVDYSIFIYRAVGWLLLLHVHPSHLVYSDPNYSIQFRIAPHAQGSHGCYLKSVALKMDHIVY